MITHRSSALDAVKQGGQTHPCKLLQATVGGSGRVVAPASYVLGDEWRERVQETHVRMTYCTNGLSVLLTMMKT